MALSGIWGVKRKRYVRVHSLINQAVIADKCLVAECFLDRLKGLIGRSVFEPGDGMLFPKCNDIHMWFMKIPIDVLFLRPVKTDGESTVWKVSSMHENVRPWKPIPLVDWRASETLELPAGSVRTHAISAGDEICINSLS